MKRLLLALCCFCSIMAIGQEVVNGNREFVAGTGVAIQIPNASSTGTTLHKLAKLTGAPSTAVLAQTTDTGGIVGIVIDGAGTSGSASILRAGEASCVFDGATTAGHYVQISSSVNGDCTDGGVTYPTSGQVLGKVLSTNGAGGTYVMTVTGAEVQGSSSGGSSNRNMPEFMKGVCQGCALGGTAGVSIPGNFAATTGPTPYGIPGSSTTAGFGVAQFKNVGVFLTGDSITYGPFVVPSNYTTNANIVLHFAIADHVQTSGTVTIGCSYADATVPAVVQPTLFSTGYNTGAVTLSGTIDNTVAGTCTLTPNTAGSPTVTAGDQIWFSVWFSAHSGSATPYLTAYWSY